MELELSRSGLLVGAARLLLGLLIAAFTLVGVGLALLVAFMEATGQIDEAASTVSDPNPMTAGIALGSAVFVATAGIWSIRRVLP